MWACKIAPERKSYRIIPVILTAAKRISERLRFDGTVSAKITIYAVRIAQDVMDLAAQTIVVVEDDSDAREALGELLAHCGYSVAYAENGVAALHQVRTWRALPALILLDLFMPVMDGNTFPRYARQDCRIKDVPIILMTGDVFADTPGVDAILTKPLRPERLLPEVSRFVKPIKISNSVSQ